MRQSVRDSFVALGRLLQSSVSLCRTNSEACVAVPSTLIQACVLGIRVTLRAVRSRLLNAAIVSTADVLLLSDRLQMRRVAARSVATKMIELKPIGYRSDEQLVSYSMSKAGPKSLLVEAPVSERPRACPHPARRRLVHEGPEVILASLLLGDGVASPRAVLPSASRLNRPHCKFNRALGTREYNLCHHQPYTLVVKPGPLQGRPALHVL